MLGAVVATLVYEKLLSQRALSTSCHGGCCGPRDQLVGEPFETEVMLDENNQKSSA